jgi:hypothetical protein
MSKIILLIFLHIFGDSVLLSKDLRKLKIHSKLYLLKHVGIYSAVLLIAGPFLLNLTIVESIEFSLLNGILHYFIDYLITLYKLKYWINDLYKYVIVYSVLEHILHITILIGTFLFLFPHAANLDIWYKFVDHYLSK